MKDQSIKMTYSNEDYEITLLLEALFIKYGYDFRNYSRAHIKRRVMNCLNASKLSNISEMQHKVLFDEDFLQFVLPYFSINVTEMFRDPSFYKAFRESVVPILSTYPFIRIWHAGCATGEEVYYMAILLKEVGLYNRTQIYATDISESAIEKAKRGKYPINVIKEYTRNYQNSGGTESFADYYKAEQDYVVFDNAIKEKIVFTEHNLVTDGVFGEMNVIICRNVLIYFNRQLQNRVLKLFSSSLDNGCFLCLGSKEDIRFSECSEDFIPFNESEKIYRKKFGR
jgi:chemotaxis protein methyltransferase CheR